MKPYQHTTPTLQTVATIKRIVRTGFISLIALSGTIAHAVDIIWDNGGADDKFSTADNWDSNTVPSGSDYAFMDIGGTVTHDSGQANSMYNAIIEGGTTFNMSGGTFSATQSNNNVRFILGRNGAGTINQSDGTISIGHMMAIGWGDAGDHNLSGGTLNVYRGGNNLQGSPSNPSISIGASSGAGILTVSGGTLTTRAGVELGTNAVFEVNGSGATEIGIGSHDNIDGFWYQLGGATLSAGIDLGGLTKIFIDDVEGTGGNFATFQPGSLLDVDYYNGGFGGGTWTVLELENGDIDAGVGNANLSFAPGVDTAIWSFNIDNSGANGILTVTAVGDPAGTFGNWFKIEAEDRDGQAGTQLETTSDTGDGQNVSHISNGDWCRYDDVTLGDNALLNFRIARNSGTDDGHIEVRLGSTTGTLIAQIDVPDTGGWQNWETISVPLAPTSYSTQEDIYLVFVETSTTNGGSMFNLNWWSKTAMVDATEQTAVGGHAKFETAQDIGGGQNLGWITDGEWMEYTIEPEVAGWHRFDFRVASSNSDGYINIVLGGQSIGTVNVGATGGFQSWVTESAIVELPTAGSQTIRLEFVVPTNGYNLNWFSYETAPEPEPPLIITVGNTPKQKMRYGIDYERLWYWTGTNAQKDLVAEWSVADADVDFVRVAMNSKYELDEGVFDLNAYTGDGGYPSNDRIIPMMLDMKAANPDVKFFASPRPLNESHNAISGVAKDDIPWQPYPIWVTGAPSYTSGSFNFNDIKCAEYIVKYLLLMKSYGFQISYLDVTNEWQSNVGGARVTQDDMDDIHNYLHVTYMADPWEHPDYPGITLTPSDIPQIVAPSSWNYSQGDQWVDYLDNGDKEAISIVASHNTDRTGTAQDVVDATNNKFDQTGDTVPEVWNTELHGWKSTSNADEVLTYAYMLECINAGFSGISGWLAKGTSDQGHSYFHGTTPTVKYYMFEKLTTTSNRGHALEVNEPDEFKVYWDPDPDQEDADSAVSALIRGNLMTVWVLNHSDTDYPITITPTGRTISDEPIKSTRWSQFDGLSSEGVTASITKDNDTSFTTTAQDNTAYCFEILLEPENGSYVHIEAENYDSSSPASHNTETTSDIGGGLNLSDINNGNWTSYQNIDLTQATNIRFRIASPSGSPDGEIEIRTGSQTGPVIGRTAIPVTGGWQNWCTIETPLDTTSGIHDLYLVYTEAGSNQNGSGVMFNLNWFKLGLSNEVPEAVTGLNAMAQGGTHIDLTWNSVPAATSYKVFRSTSSGGSYTEIASGLTTTRISDATASLEVQYYYKVRALNGALEGTDSNVANETLQLAEPDNLTATENGATQIDLAWDAVSGATSYRVLHATSESGTYTEIASGLTTTSTTDTTPLIGAPNYYVVRAVNGVVESDDSDVATATLPLEAPTNLTATANGATQIDLAWDAVSGATSYRVLRATSAGGTYTEIESGLTTTSTSDATASIGVTYYYVVRAINGAVESEDSNVATETLQLVAPTNLTATANGSTQIDLAWDAVTGATSYRVLRATSPGGTYTELASGLTATSTSDATASIGITYYYVVRAISGAGESADSNEADATLPLERPTGLSAIPISASQIDLSWNSVTGATSYTVQQSSAPRGPYSDIATGIVSLSYSDSIDLTPGTRYYYRVYASAGTVDSLPSSATSVVPSNPVDAENILFDPPTVDFVNNIVDFSILNSELGHNYQAQQRQDLTIGDWVDVGAVKQGNGGVLDFTIPILETDTQFFYRVNITQQ